MIQAIDNMVKNVNEVLYEPYIVPLILVLAGLYFTVRTRGLQFRMLIESVRIIGQKPTQSGGTSSFGALMLSTAARVGTGNIMGVSFAICMGGPGAIFWMWMIAVLGSATAFVESTLAQIYKKRNKDGSSYGGPAYYMQDALGQRWLGTIFSVVLILTYAVGYNMLTAYNLQDSLAHFSFYGPAIPYIVGIVLAALFSACVLGGARRLITTAEVLVPIMGVTYVLVSMFVVITHISALPEICATICRSAFDFQAIFGGFTGSCVMLGLKRGLYSNEAGMGSAPNAAAAADVPHPVQQGLVQMLSVFIDTIIICSATAFLCLFSGVNPTPETAGAVYVQASAAAALGYFGPIFITFTVGLFAFTTLIGNYYYTEGCLRFLLKKHPDSRFLLCYRLCATILIFLGTVISANLAWETADLLQAIMVLLNVPTIFLLFRPALSALRDYEKQRREGSTPIYRAQDNGVEGTEFWQ